MKNHLLFLNVLKNKTFLIVFMISLVNHIKAQNYPELNGNYNINQSQSTLYSVFGNDLTDWYYFESPNSCQGFHCGDDFYAEDWNWGSGGDADLGQTVYCGFDTAEVLSITNISDDSNSFGNRVVLRSINNPDFALLYAHLEDILIAEGDIICAGDLIGTIGKTGLPPATPETPYYAHLHLVLYKNITQGNAINNLMNGLAPSNDFYGSPTSYAVDFDVKAPIVASLCNPCASYEPNNNALDAEYIPELGKELDITNLIYNSCLDFTIADEDWYSFSVGAQGLLDITLTNQAFNFDLELYDVGTQLIETGVLQTNGDRIIQWCDSGNTCSEVYVRVSTNQSWPQQNFEYDLAFNWDYNSGCTPQSPLNNDNFTNNTMMLSISGDTEICYGENATLISNGGSGNYKWFSNGSEIGSGTSITLSSLVLGQTTIQVVDLAINCTTASTIITVTNGITAEAGQDVTITNGSSTQLQAMGGSSYSWLPATGLSNPNIANPIASPTETTTYTLTISENDCTDTDQIVINVTANAVVDLIVDNTWTVPSNPEVGEYVDLYVQIKNIGNETAYSFSWNYFINANNIGSDSHALLQPNDIRVEHFENYIFSSSGGFDYCVEIVPEPNESIITNNSYCYIITVAGTTPEDLVVTNTSISSNTVNAGNNLTASVDHYYSGGNPTSELPDIALGIYLSNNCNLSNDDILLKEVFSSIGSDNLFDTETESITIPEATQSGSYFIIFKADNRDVITESNENNNTICRNITINSTYQEPEAGIVNPTNNLIIHEDNRDTYFLTNDLDEMHIDGWSNTGNITNIKIYKLLGATPNTNTDTFIGSAQNPNTGSWYKDIFVSPGLNKVYINVRCNYAGCSINGSNSEVRCFTYVRPYETGDFYLSIVNDYDVRITLFPDYGIGGINTGFYYRIFRNTTNTFSGITAINDWTQETTFIDNNTQSGQTYYYWIDVAMNNSGSYNSGLIESQYHEITTQTLSIDEENVSDYIQIFPNPTLNQISIHASNNIIVQEVSIFNIEGRLIQKTNNDFENIITNNLANGIYLFTIKTNKGISTKRIIKE